MYVHTCVHIHLISAGLLRVHQQLQKGPSQSQAPLLLFATYCTVCDRKAGEEPANKSLHIPICKCSEDAHANILTLYAQ